jgi:hypothetical protein
MVAHNVKEYMIPLKFMRTFIAIIIVFSSLQLSAMEQEKVAIDTQIYQLLSFATQNNPECYLPQEVTHIIAFNTHEITQLNVYKKYGEHIKNENSLLHFIDIQSDTGMDIASTVHIIKACLYCSGKSLGTLTTTHLSVLHTVFCSGCIFHPFKEKNQVYCLNTLCQVIGKDLKDFLYMKHPVSGDMMLSNSTFDICKKLLWMKVKINKEFFKTFPFSNWGDKIKAILKYLNEEERAQILFDSFKVKEEEIMREIENEDDSVD